MYKVCRRQKRQRICIKISKPFFGLGSSLQMAFNKEMIMSMQSPINPTNTVSGFGGIAPSSADQQTTRQATDKRQAKDKVADNALVLDDKKTTFADLDLAAPILGALQSAGYVYPTPIQAQAIPPSMAGQDLLLSAQTGSGKTAAFVLPILDRLAKSKSQASYSNQVKPSPKGVSAVILTPTRELALQVHDSVRRYGERLKNIFSVVLVGGAPYGGQIRALKKGVQIIVATPGRFIDHLNDGRIDLDDLQTLVLDEADRMLDMGFSDAISTILTATPNDRQTIMSSATWDGQVGKIAESFTTNPKRVAIKVESAHIEESVYFCDDFRHKNDILYQVLNNPNIDQAVIFASTKMSTEKLANDLVEKGYKARYLHGDLPQGKRNRIVADVKAGKCQFLVATDVAARGIDIASISHVVNYDLPRQAEDYVHRIGRCGRAGRTGTAINLCSVDDRSQFFAINRYLGREMTVDVLAGLEPKRNFDEPERQKNKRQRDRRTTGNKSYKKPYGAKDGNKERFGKEHSSKDGFGGDRFNKNSDRPYRAKTAKSGSGKAYGVSSKDGGKFNRSSKSDDNNAYQDKKSEKSPSAKPFGRHQAKKWDDNRPKRFGASTKKSHSDQGYADRKRQHRNEKASTYQPNKKRFGDK